MEVTRNEFLKCCAAGICSCVALTSPELAAAETSNSNIEQMQQQLEASRIRYAKLVSILEKTLDEATRQRIFDSLGRECARQFCSRTFDKYKGDLAGFLKSVEGPDGWAVKTEYDEKAGIIRVFDRGPHCSCPLVKEGLTSGAQCDCTLGWQRETYSAILGRPVDAAVEESILRGGKRCVFRMTVLEQEPVG
jgi:predicted hydrocarbon binding protein